MKLRWDEYARQQNAPLFTHDHNCTEWSKLRTEKKYLQWHFRSGYLGTWSRKYYKIQICNTVFSTFLRFQCWWRYGQLNFWISNYIKNYLSEEIFCRELKFLDCPTHEVYMKLNVQRIKMISQYKSGTWNLTAAQETDDSGTNVSRLWDNHSRFILTDRKILIQMHNRTEKCYRYSWCVSFGNKLQCK